MKKSTKVLLCVIGIFLVTSILIGMSYALWVFSVSQESTNVVRSDCFEITYSDGNAINLTNTIPLTDKEARELDPYSFTIKNICNQVVDYSVNIETLNTSTMDLDAVATKLDGKKKQILGQLDDNVKIVNNDASSSKTIYSSILKAGEEKTHNLRLWVDVDATKEQSMSKSFSSKVVVSGVLHPNYNELISGKDFNIELKKLAGNDNPSEGTSNTTITSIEWSDSAPQDSDNAVNVASNLSTKPIYAWFKDGIIYLNSDTDKIYMNSDSSNMFYNMNGITSINLDHFDTSAVTDMWCMFSGLKKLTTLDVSNFDTSNVTRMGRMFQDMVVLTNLDVSHFDTSKVTSMWCMFDSLKNLDSLDVSNFDTSNVTSMGDMFNYMYDLTSLDVSGFDTSKVTDMGSMFAGLKKVTSLDVNHFDTSNVTDMSYMFAWMNSLPSLDISNFNTSKVKYMTYMFCDLKSITSIDLSNFDTSNVIAMSSMFKGMTNITSLDLSTFDTSNVTGTDYMFNKMTNLTTVYVSDLWDISHITIYANSGNMFSDDTQLVGGAGTTYDSSHINGEYARVDDPQNGNPGYFTLKTS